jgi:polyhydroxyalkanoate synthesis repressor PhaR
MIRLIKRYGSRKLYDTEESRYVSLEEIGDWVRKGQQVQVIDNQSSDDVTAQTLTQVILEEGKRGMSSVSSDFLHDLIRRGGQVVSLGVQSVQDGMDRLIQASVDRVPPLRQVRDETDELRRRLDALEAAIGDIERGRGQPAAADTVTPDRPRARRPGPARGTRKKGA